MTKHDNKLVWHRILDPDGLSEGRFTSISVATRGFTLLRSIGCADAPVFGGINLDDIGALIGGIAVALALSLSSDLILHMIYLVVIFSILVQGMTIGQLVKKLMPEREAVK